MKFYMEPPWPVGMKIYINDPNHITKMTDMPIYGKNIITILQNKKPHDLEILNGASETSVTSVPYNGCKFCRLISRKKRRREEKVSFGCCRSHL